MPKSSSLTWPSAVTSTFDGFEIAMHDQVGVRVGDRRLHVEEQADARLDAEPLLVAEAVDVPALDVLEHEVRLAGGRDAGVDEARDVRMGEPREDRAFALEALFAGAADQRGVQQLERRLALEAAVAAGGEPDRAHAAVADRRDQRVGADRDARRAAGLRRGGRPARRRGSLRR